MCAAEGVDGRGEEGGEEEEDSLFPDTTITLEHVGGGR